VVATTMVAIKALVQESWAALSALSSRCEDSEYKVHDSYERILKKLALMQPDGRVHDVVREIVLSAVIWDNTTYEFTIVPPIAGS
jgi:hypothetical protein